MALTTDPNNTTQQPQLPPHPYANRLNNTQNPVMMNPNVVMTGYPSLQAASSNNNNNNMVQLPVLPHQQQVYPSLQGGSTMYTGAGVVNNNNMPNQPLPPVQFVGNNHPQQPQFIQPQMVTITTTTTENGGAAQVSTEEDATLRLAGRSIARQMWEKLKQRVRSPTALIGSLCNLLSLTLVFEVITMLALSFSGGNVPAYLHAVFWIMLAIEIVSMILKSPVLMLLNLILNFTCFVMAIVASKTSYVLLQGFGIIIALFFFSGIFTIRLGVRYLQKVNAQKTAAVEAAENGGQISQNTAETLQSHNPFLALVESLRKNQKIAMEYKISDLLIGAE
ncbi:hypothetical protein C9374_009493 [Naegleria lovaniensis]|uniref:Uncharacterized protein n=1 Tax=Naegleria lovaniensis TaxID=51637 RepID=A0AA88KR04_NAELO|nr:uncharacterized protein C9374_009493 [Naegleria lovaniensis]KAG2392916.1 hypothetical protein C9374_009493 [Naegleria lovaniensis]